MISGWHRAAPYPKRCAAVGPIRVRDNTHCQIREQARVAASQQLAADEFLACGSSLLGIRLEH
jgi:hypothetical protein